MSYTPTPGQLEGDQYIPSNGIEGECFMEDWCRRCARDRAMREAADFDDCDDNELCEIIGAAFRGEAVEWRELPDGATKCIAFVPAGESVPPPRCERTQELF